MYMYISQLLLVVIAVLVSGSLEAVYEGKGNIFFTYYEYKPIKSGLRIVYIPLEPDTYASPELEAKIGFKQYSTGTLSDLYYTDEILAKRDSWTAMSWNAEGEYYYYDNPNGALIPGKTYGYGLEIFNSSGAKVYEDVKLSKFHVRRDWVRYCTHDAPGSNLENKCSDVVSPGIRYPITTTTTTKTTEKVIAAGTTTSLSYLSLCIATCLLFLLR